MPYEDISEPTQPQTNTHMTVASRSCSPGDARWSLLRVDISGGRECDAHFFLSPPAHLASLSGRSIVFSIADLTVCEFYGTGRAGRISCFLLYWGSARVCRRPYDSLIFLFKLEDRTWQIQSRTKIQAVANTVAFLLCNSRLACLMTAIVLR